MDDVVVLVDVDNTLLDNDAIIEDLRRHLAADFGAAHAERYFVVFEALRREVGYADYLGALQRWRVDLEAAGDSSEALLSVSRFLAEYPFAHRLYPRALEALAALSRLGPTVVLSDGDVVFQPLKVRRSGIWDAVDGRVLIFIHKETMLAAVERRFPARRYVMVDDKPRILAAMKRVWEDRVVTVFPRQGHYALDAAEVARHPSPDHTVDAIGELCRSPVADWLALTAQESTT